MIPVVLVLVLFAALIRAQAFVYGRLWNKGLRAELSFGAAEVFEGDTVAFRESVTNGKHLPLPYLRLAYRQSTALCPLDSAGRELFAGRERETLFAAPPMKTLARTRTLHCRKRGYYEIDGGVLQSSDLFLSRLFRKEVPLSARLTVFPGRLALSEEELPLLRHLGQSEIRRSLQPDPFVFAGLREYQSRDSYRQINFKAWAKTGMPMSNIYGHTAARELTIFLNLTAYTAGQREGVYENAIRLAAFLAQCATEAGSSVCLHTNAPDCGTGKPTTVTAGTGMRHLHALYEVLARIDLPKAPRGLSDLPSCLPGEDGRQDGRVVLISSYENDMLRAWFADSRAAGMAVFWVAPWTAEDGACPVTAEGVTPWEVPRE